MRSLVVLFMVVFGSLTGCSPPEEPTKEPICSQTKPCDGGRVCRIDEAKPELNACVTCERDRECARDEFCHPLERLCRLKPCFGHECEVHDDCGLGEFCVQGLCLVGSATTSAGCSVRSCADGEVCELGERCHPINGVCEEDLGCAVDIDCGEAQRCVAGRCELACTPETSIDICGLRRVCDEGACVDCVADNDCGAGLTCDRTQKTCVSPFSCANNRDCKAPLVCNRVTRECTVDPGPCVSEGDCPDDETCQLSTGKCVPRECLPDRFEPNDTLGTASLLPNGATTGMTLCRDDVDYYKLPLENGDRVQVVVDVDTLLGFDVAILGPLGEVLTESDFSARATANVDGDYFIRTRSGDAYVRYGLRVTVSRGVPCVDDTFEPNDIYVDATAIEPGDYLGLQICPGNVDWYQIAVAANETVEVQIETTALQGDLDLYLYDTDAKTLLQSSVTVNDVEKVRSGAFTGSRVFAKVVGAASTTRNAYDLRMRVSR